MQNISGFDNLAASIEVEETRLEDSSSNVCSNSEGTKTNMSHARSFTKTSNYDYHRRKAMSTILVFL